MKERLPGIGGSLFPGQYLTEALADDARILFAPAPSDHRDRRRRQLQGWWRQIDRTCGPATSVRALFDRVALPLTTMLGFRARTAEFDRHRARAVLETRTGGAVALLVRPWADRPSSAWRDLAEMARESGASWALVCAPPYVSIVDVRGHSLRRALDFSFPEVLSATSFEIFWTLADARAFERVPCPLDRLAACAERFADRVRDDLQRGVIDAMDALVRGLGARRGRLAGKDESFQEALTIVYRVLFLLFAESRDLVPRGHPIYRDAYTVTALCHEAGGPTEARGLWEALAAITRLSRSGCRTDDLIVRPFNGRLFARRAAPSLEAAPKSRRPSRGPDPRDSALRHTLVALATRPGRAGRETISYADLGVEQLGAVYERVLDLDPDDFGRDRPLSAPTRHSARRKETGTFYTPRALCDFVVRRTLAPLVSGAMADGILQLRIVDPAMGSGAFLVAACHYLARAYEQALIDEGRLSHGDVDERLRADFRRLVAERCLAGVDRNPVAVQLARLSLWLATLADGKPLTFLDHRLRCGNSLVGASPDDLNRVSSRRAGPERSLTFPLFNDADLELSIGRVCRPLRDLATRRDDTIDDVHAKEAQWAALVGDRSPLRPWRAAANLWCARWFWPSGSPPSDPEMRAALDAILKGDSTLHASTITRLLDAAETATVAHGLFHWTLEFADAFYDEHGHPMDRPGFDAVIGNPPWEMLRHDQAGASDTRSLVRFIRESGLYPSCDRGHVNLYQPFVERALSLARPGGRVGLILPWGLAVDDGASALRSRLLDRTSVDSIVGLDNGAGLFPIHRGLRFLALTTTTAGRTTEIRARFGVKTSEELSALPARGEGGIDSDAIGNTSAWPVHLTGRTLRLIGGSSRRIPDLRRADDLELVEKLFVTAPALGDARGWGAEFGRELNATDDREHFGDRGLPVVDGKHVQPFVVRPDRLGRRIARTRAVRLLVDGRFDRARVAYRDVSGIGNRFAVIAAVLPAGVVSTHTLFCLKTDVSIEQQHFLCGVLNSHVVNHLARLLMGGHVTTGLMESLPVPPWTGSASERRIARLAARLSEGSRTTALVDKLQAAVARWYGLDERTYTSILRALPIATPDERAAALAAFQRHDRPRTQTAI